MEILCTQAFAWFSDLLVEHAEKFWQLFSVDMNDVLERQLPDTWDSFPLFQLLNDYLRMDENLAHGRFHNHIRDVFAPQVVRYVDLMESSIAQSIHKGTIVSLNQKGESHYLSLIIQFKIRLAL